MTKGSTTTNPWVWTVAEATGGSGLPGLSAAVTAAAAAEVTRRTLEQRELTHSRHQWRRAPRHPEPPRHCAPARHRGSPHRSRRVPERDERLRRRHARCRSSPLRWALSVIPTEMLEQDRSPRQLQLLLRARHGRDRRRRRGRDAEEGRKIHGLAQADSSTRAPSRGPIGTRVELRGRGRRSYVDVWLKPVLRQPAPASHRARLLRLPAHAPEGLGQGTRASASSSSAPTIASRSSSRPSTARTPASAAASRSAPRSIVCRRATRQAQRRTEVRLTAAVGEDASILLGDNFFVLRRTRSTRAPSSRRSSRPGVTAQHRASTCSTRRTRSIVRLPPPPRPGQPPPAVRAHRPLDLATTTRSIGPRSTTRSSSRPSPARASCPAFALDYAKDTRAWDVQPRVVVPAGSHARVPADDAQGRRRSLLRSRRSRRRPTRSSACPARLEHREPLRRRRRAGAHTHRARSRASTPVRQPWSRSASATSARAARSASRRSSATSPTSASSGSSRTRCRAASAGTRPTAGAALQLRSDAHPDRRRQLSPRQRLGDWRALPLVSGNLNTPQTYGFYDANVGVVSRRSRATRLNGIAIPMFHQLDVRIDKTWSFKTSKLSAYLDIYNAYNRATSRA